LTSALVRVLDAVNLPGLIANEPSIVTGYRAYSEDGTMTDLTTAWRGVPVAAEFFEALRPLADIHRRVGSHVDYKAPQPASSKYVSRSNSPDTIERAHRTELENDRSRAEAEAARPHVQPRPNQVLGVGARN
jgi:hypothetical protein